MPGLYWLFGLLHRMEEEHELRHPKPRHFRVFFRKPGYMGHGWWAQHKFDPSLPLLGPYKTKEEADRMVEAVVLALKEKYEKP